MRSFNMKLLKYAILFVLLTPLSVYASDGHGRYYTFIWQTIDLIIFFAVILTVNYKMGNPIAESWEKRWKQIDKDVKKGAKVYTSAEERMREARNRLNDIDNAIASVIERINNETAVESEQIMESAKGKAESILTQAQTLASLEKANSEKVIKDELVEMVVENALERLRQNRNYEADRSRRFATVDLLRAWKAEHGMRSFGN